MLHFVLCRIRDLELDDMADSTPIQYSVIHSRHSSEDSPIYLNQVAMYWVMSWREGMLSSLENRSSLSPFTTKSLIHGNKCFSLFSVNIVRSLFRYISVYSYIGNNVVWLQLWRQFLRRYNLSWGTGQGKEKTYEKSKNYRSNTAFQKRHGFAQSISSAWFGDFIPIWSYLFNLFYLLLVFGQ